MFLDQLKKYQQATDIVLNLITKLQKENEEKDRQIKTLNHTNKTYKGMLNKQSKQIDLMAEHIVSSAIVDDTVCAIKCDCETDIEEDCTHEKMLNCTKQYFKSKAEKE